MGCGVVFGLVPSGSYAVIRFMREVWTQYLNLSINVVKLIRRESE
jgi:hypothetical protein